MCLGIVYDKELAFEVVKLKNGIGFGWKKYLLGKDGRLYSLFQGLQGKPVPVNKWLHEENFRYPDSINFIVSDSGEAYQKGFHIYPKFKDAVCGQKRRVRRKVKFKGIVAYGVEGHLSAYAKPVLVVEEMLVLPRRRKKK